MSIGTIILIILVIALLGGFSGIGGGPFYGTGYYGGGGLGLIIVILLILLLMGKLAFNHVWAELAALVQAGRCHRSEAVGGHFVRGIAQSPQRSVQGVLGHRPFC